MCGVTLYAVIIVICGLVSFSQSLNVTISPEHAHISPGSNLNIMCKADQPLTKCQFKVRHLPVYDLSQGSFTDHNDEYSYLGEGLENGDCGMKLQGTVLKYVVYVVGCRVRSTKSDWVFAEMTLINKKKKGFKVDFSPGRQVIVQPGSPIKVVVDVKEPLSLCTFVLANDLSRTKNNTRYNFYRNNTPADSNPKGTDIEYYGTGVDQGQCGFQMARASEEHNDGAWVDVLKDKDNEETLFFRLIVARAPIKVDLFQNITNNNDGTVTLSAWCSVRSRPAALITWFLQGQQIPVENTELIPTEGWTWPSNIQKVEQKLTLQLNSSDRGKELWCKATHIGLTEPKESNRIKITFYTPPSAVILDVDTSLLSEGAWMEATCSVYGGQPGLKVTWYIGDDIVRRDDKDDNPQPSAQDQRLTQNLKQILQTKDNGRELRCEVTHQLLPQPLQARRLIKFSLCPPLVSDSLVIHCSLGGEPVDCGLPHLVGTIAQLRCQSGNIVTANIVYRRIRCLRNATWDRPLFTCKPSCGRRNTNSGTVLISNGEDSKIGEFPWHVGTYEMTSPTKFVQTCGGTLITPSTVVSAAHCFWSEQDQLPKSADKVKVAVGKFIRVWEDPNPTVQKRNVSRIILPLRYNGRISKFASDISLLRLAVDVQITATVNLICMDWDNLLERKMLVVGNNGTVAGWGYTQDGEQSQNLKYLNLPFVEDNACSSSLSFETAQIFTHDKFCAGYVNKSTSVCSGDSGGGLVFRDPASDLYYLRGIVSIAFTPSIHSSICYNQYYTGFTKVSLFIPWILDNV